MLIRSAGFCLLFLNSLLSFSLDKWLGLDFGLSSPSLVGLNFCCWTFTVLMFSAGWEKLCSPMWRRGLGFFYFMSLRHWVKPRFHWANKSRAASIVMSWVHDCHPIFLVIAMLVPSVRWLSFHVPELRHLPLPDGLPGLPEHPDAPQLALLVAIEFSPWIGGGPAHALPAGSVGSQSPLLWVACFFSCWPSSVAPVW